jgi:hypothetical protein
MTTKSTTFPLLAQAQTALSSLQTEAAELLGALGKGARKLLGQDPHKAVGSLFNQAKVLPTGLQKRAEKKLKALETRARKLLSEVQSDANERVRRLFSQFSLPSKREVELLAKRLSTLETKVDDILSAERRGR